MAARGRNLPGILGGGRFHVRCEGRGRANIQRASQLRGQRRGRSSPHCSCVTIPRTARIEIAGTSRHVWGMFLSVARSQNRPDQRVEIPIRADRCSQPSAIACAPTRTSPIVGTNVPSNQSPPMGKIDSGAYGSTPRRSCRLPPGPRHSSGSGRGRASRSRHFHRKPLTEVLGRSVLVPRPGKSPRRGAICARGNPVERS